MKVCCRTVTVVGRKLVFDQLTSALDKQQVFSRHDNPQTEISLFGPKLKKFQKSTSSKSNQCECLLLTERRLSVSLSGKFSGGSIPRAGRFTSVLCKTNREQRQIHEYTRQG